MNKVLIGVLGGVIGVAIAGTIGWNLMDGASANGDTVSAAPAVQIASASTKLIADPDWTFEPHPLDKVLGDANAPVTLLDYSSLTCGHCADFHTKTLPKVMEKYVDTGKIRFVFRDFPIGELAMVAAVMPHCAGGEKYHGLLGLIFKGQTDWIRNKDPYGALLGVARFAGLSEENVQTCLKDKALLTGLTERASAAQKKYGFDSTPSFVLNGRKLIGNLPWEDFSKAIDDLLADAAKG